LNSTYAEVPLQYECILGQTFINLVYRKFNSAVIMTRKTPMSLHCKWTVVSSYTVRCTSLH